MEGFEMAETAVVRKAIILAAGRGKRLGVLTADRPKPMIIVRGKPVLEHILIGLHDCGITDILIVKGYLGDAITSHFGSGASLGLNIVYADQPIPTGTGAALELGKDFSGGNPVVCSFGDILTVYAHYQALIGSFATTTSAAVLGINWVEDPSAGGAVYRDGDRVTRVVEKPPPGTSQSNWNLAGVNVFSSEIFNVLETVKPSPRGEVEITSAYAALIETGKMVRAVEMRGFWSDVGTPESLAEAEQRWTLDSKSEP